MIKTGSDFSGVGAFNQALIRLGIDHDELFACDMDKYARQTFILNYGEPKYYPENVYNREIPSDSLDIYMTSPPCQSFSLAGKRKGEDSKNGVLFYNSHEFIQKNKPRYFIFENVKGLLSDDGGKTFQRWIDYLGGKTVNGNPVIFPHEKSVPYHVYYQMMNAKHYGVPQNRERIFIIGIRDDADNEFSFPKPFHLVKRLKDVLQSEVDEKYFLSDKMLNHLIKHPRSQDFINEETDSVSCITANYAKQSSDLQYLETKIGAIRGRNPQNPLSRVSGLPTEQMLEINESGVSNALTTVQKDNVVVIPANNSKGYDIAEEESDPVIVHNIYGGFNEDEPRFFHNYSPAIRTSAGGGHLPSAIINKRIRRLTPKECFSLMDFNEDFKWDVSDSQAYKQAGNSIVVACLEQIIKKLNLT